MILDKQGVIDYIIQSPNFANEVFNLDNCKFRGDCFINLYVNDPETYKRRCIEAGAVQRDGGLAFPDGKQFTLLPNNLHHYMTGNILFGIGVDSNMIFVRNSDKFSLVDVELSEKGKKCLDLWENKELQYPSKCNNPMELVAYTYILLQKIKETFGLDI